MSTSLEQRIATALADNDASSTLSALIEEIEAATTAADAEAEQARVRVLDPTVIDAHKARVALPPPSDVIVYRPRCSRLCSVCRRRRRRSAPRGGNLKYERVEAKRDELARNYAARGGGA